MSATPWSKLGTEFLSEGDWAVGQGPDAPDRQLFRLLVRTLNETSPRHVRVLEAGHGPGIDVAALAAEGLLAPAVYYEGLDFTLELVAYCRERFPDVSFFVRDVQDFEVESRFDLVYCRHLLEHVPDVEAALRNLYEASRRVVLVSWFIRPTWSPGEAREWEDEDSGVLHRVYDARELIEFIGSLGARLYRFDFDHAGTRAAAWLLARQEEPRLVETAHRFLASRGFLGALEPAPPDPRLDVLEDAARALRHLLKPIPDYVEEEARASLERVRAALREGGRDDPWL